MVEIGFIAWFAGYLLWLASTLAMGEFKKSFVSITILYAALPLIIVLGVFVLLVVSPLAVVFSQSVRDSVIRQREVAALKSFNKEKSNES